MKVRKIILSLVSAIIILLPITATACIHDIPKFPGGIIPNTPSSDNSDASPGSSGVEINLSPDTPDDSTSSFMPKVTFTVSVPAVTPAEDDVYLELQNFGPVKMNKIGENIWQIETTIPPNVDVKYGYDRNDVGFEASEEVSAQDTPNDWYLKRSIKAAPFEEIEQDDTINKWRWLLNEPIEADINYSERPEFLPRINGQLFQKGIPVQDYWWDVFYYNGETEDTVGRIVADNANYVQYSPTWALVVTDDSVELERGCSYCYPEKAIRYESETANQANLNVVFRNQVWMELPPEEVLKERSEGWWQQYYQVRREYLLDMARYAQEEGVQAMSIGAAYDTISAFTVWDGSSAPEESWTQWVKDIRKVREIYTGELYYDFNPGGGLQDFFSIDMEKFQPILDELDFVGIAWWKGISDKDNSALEELEINASEQFDRYLKPIYEKTGKPIVLTSIAFPSADGGSTAKYEVNSRTVDAWKYDDGVYNDFQEQANVYEAIMRAVAGRPWIVGTYPFGFWRHDQQDKGFNIRGKPAEDVVKSWYSIISDNP